MDGYSSQELNAERKGEGGTHAKQRKTKRNQVHADATQEKKQNQNRKRVYNVPASRKCANSHHSNVPALLCSSKGSSVHVTSGSSASSDEIYEVEDRNSFSS